MQIVPITSREELDAFFSIVTRGSIAAKYVAARAKPLAQRLAEAEAGARAAAAEGDKIIAESHARRSGSAGGRVMAALTPRAGARYIARNGMVTTPVEVDPGVAWPVAAEIGNRFEIWTSKGLVFGPNRPHPHDLVAEYVEIDAIAT